MTEKTIVRQNMMDNVNYTPYCGGNCSTTPRTFWVGKKLKCPKCGWMADFDAKFMNRYLDKWYGSEAE